VPAEALTALLAIQPSATQARLPLGALATGQALSLLLRVETATTETVVLPAVQLAVGFAGATARWTRRTFHSALASCFRTP
jgi:ABC-type dipeptide/oligopeptide/nickel transport system permease component